MPAWSRLGPLGPSVAYKRSKSSISSIVNIQKSVAHLQMAYAATIPGLYKDNELLSDPMWLM